MHLMLLALFPRLLAASQRDPVPEGLRGESLIVSVDPDVIEVLNSLHRESPAVSCGDISWQKRARFLD